MLPRYLGIYSLSSFMGGCKLNHGKSFDNTYLGIDIHAILTYRDRHNDHLAVPLTAFRATNEDFDTTTNNRRIQII